MEEGGEGEFDGKRVLEAVMVGFAELVAAVIAVVVAVSLKLVRLPLVVELLIALEPAYLDPSSVVAVAS